MPLLIAANRDEVCDRPSAPPGELAPGITGGRDLLAGGTWLAVSATRRICLVTNRRTESAGEVHRDPDRRSRGEIPVLVLQTPDQEVPALLESFGPGRYNPVNVLHASARGVHVAHVDDSGPPRVLTLDSGPHVLTVRDIDHPSAAKDQTLRQGLETSLRESTDAPSGLARMEEMLRSHSTPSGEWLDATCIHGETYGTVSSSTVVLGDDGIAYRFAAGRPCVTPFSEVALA